MSLLLLVLACLLLWLSRRRHVFAPARMFLYGWLLVLGVTSIGMVRYDRPLAIETFLLVAGSMFAFWAGARLVPSTQVRPLPYGRLRDDFDRLTLGFLCALSALGIGIVLRDLASGGLSVLLNFSTESAIVRSARWADYYAGEQNVSPIRSFAVVSSLAVATLLPYATKFRKRLLQALSLLSAAAVAADSLLSAGRFQIGVLAMALVIGAALVYGNLRLLTVRRVLLGFAVCVYFFVIFPTQRNPDLADYAEQSVWREADASFAPWVERAATLPGFSWLEVFAASTAYFATSLDKLNYFVTETDAMSWYRLGLYNVPQISQVMAAVSDETTPWMQTRLDIAALMRREGWNGNPWSTGVRDLGIDFGIVGAVLALFLIGYASQYVFERANVLRSHIALISATYVSIGAFLFAFVSPFQIRILSNGIWILAVLALARYIVRQAVGKP